MVMLFLLHFFLIFSSELTALPKMGPVFLRNCNCLGVKAGGLFIWVVFFLLFLVAASRAFLAPNEAPPPYPSHKICYCFVYYF